MYSNRENYINTSTPKRRRLGTGRILRPSLDVFHKKFSPVHSQVVETKQALSERCESPPIPCNQNEYLYESGNNTSSSMKINIPRSPEVFDCSLDCGEVSYLPSQIGKCNLQNDKENKNCSNNTQCVLDDIEHVSDDMFLSRMEAPQPQIGHNNELMTSRCEQYFRQNIQESFELVNKSICGLDANQRNEMSNLFETKDSFLLDIKETSAFVEDDKHNLNNQCHTNNNSSVSKNASNDKDFYGLPLITKGLFKTYRNIEKFYGKCSLYTLYTNYSSFYFRYLY